MLIVLLDDSTTNRLFSNSMERIDRLWYNPGVVFPSSFYTITASLNVIVLESEMGNKGTLHQKRVRQRRNSLTD